MASGDTLAVLLPYGNEPPSSNYATLDLRNGHPCLDFDTTTQETAIWSFLLPRNYGGGGITVYLHWAATSATSGNIGWDVAVERDAGQDVDSDSFATAQTVTAVTVPAAAGEISVTNVAISSGSNMDSLAAGEMGRLRVRRDVSNDNATGDAELYMIEIKET